MKNNYKFKQLLPDGISVIRIIIVPIFLFTYLNGFILWANAVFIFAIITDALDGYLARKFNLTSPWGAYLDVTADFILIISIFVAFVFKAIYPFWILLVIIFMFLQFLVTSKTKIPSYDPVGKYYGAFLFMVILLTLIFSDDLIYFSLLILMVVFSVVSVLSRVFFFLTNKNKF